MVRVNRIGVEEGIRCEIVCKCEFFSAGGSIKDRIAKRMAKEAEASGALSSTQSPPTTIIEPTSGNTGIGLALVGAVKGYPVVITLPQKMSNEKVNLLKALGAQIHQTPTEAASSDPDSHISLAGRIRDALAPHSLIPDQYSNSNNALAHYEDTAQEIWDACEGRVDIVVMGVGTGGTISGVARRLKELNPLVIIVGVDPYGSILSNGEEGEGGDVVGPYEVEGIGYDFIPKVFDKALVDHWEKVNDKESFLMARRLIRSEGFLCGGSSGAAMSAAIRVLKKMSLSPDKRAVVVLPDSVRNYMTKFLNNDWMLIHKYLDINEAPTDEPSLWGSSTCKSLLKEALPTINADASLKDAFTIAKSTGKKIFPVASKGNLVGALNLSKASIKIMRTGPSILEQKISRHMDKEFAAVTAGTLLSTAAAYVATGYPVFCIDSHDGHLNEQQSNLFLLDPLDFATAQ